ncbi:helix-turn-helix domain-containing protein [Streptomyces sp. NBC_01237]|uniref:helix-turn-helix domain-containing protein n=1 Tax=Streptomyces sp. NBC_01237 TaxID=2903790 RepID=UPI002DD88087|nr:helix-turn-helix transcriptional regulator [Streptomyces sp. NBC_01237]WRZ76486.1 helix-turn-helix transcriptional regulator [Streptomyces sp. NBC_01237]
MTPRKGRPPGPVANAGNDIGELAEYLRSARLKKELTREQLASKLGCSITTVQRAEGGKTPPARDTVHGYVRVCVLDHTRAEALFNKATNFRRGRTRPNYTQAPRPDLVRTADELGAALARAWERNGRPSTREMEKRADRRYPETRASLSRSTAERISRRKSLPGSERTLKAYLIACEVLDTQFLMWTQAWRRVHERRLAARERDRRAARRAIRRQAPEAKARMREAGLIALDKFPGPVAPWSARHIPCDTVSRFRLRSVLQGTAQCPVCHELVAAGGREDRK